MNICLIGDGLTSLALAKNLVNKQINVCVYAKNIKKQKFQSRTLGISKNNFDFFNREILKLKKKLFWDIKQIEVYREKYKTKLALKRKEKILEKLEVDTGFQVICCSCNEFKSRTSCTKANVLPLKTLEKFVLQEEMFNQSKDGNFYLCQSCRSLIKKDKMPPKNEKDLLEWASFPDNFLKKVQDLSKCKESLQMNVKHLQ